MGKNLGTVGILCALSACSLVLDTEGLSGGAAQPVSALVDGEVPPEASDDAEAGLVDAAEASAAEASLPDASPEAATTPCAASHLFCDDFDTGTLVGRWDQMETTAGPLTLDATAFVSPLRSLLASIEPQAGVSVRATSLRKVVGIPAKRVRLAFDFRTPGPGPGAFEQVDFLGIYLSPPPAGYTMQFVGLFENRDGTWFERYTQGSAITTSHNPVLIARNRWVHLVVEADFSKVPAVATLTIDGVVASTHELFGSDLTNVTIRVGAGFVNSANVAWPLAYDNVIVDP